MINADKLNVVYCCDWLDNDLPDGSVQLIIADPPYYRVKGGFDFSWDTFDDYLLDVDRWAAECRRVLADNGSLFWWGSSKRIAYSQIILDKHFSLINNLVWEKAERDGLYGTTGNESMRSFPSSTERLLFYEHGGNDTASAAHRNYTLELGRLHTKIMQPLVRYMVGEMEAAGHTVQSINKALGTHMAYHWFTHPSQWSLPTEAFYVRLRELFNGEYLRREYEYLRREYEDLRREYEDLRREYEDLRRFFSNVARSTEVLKYRFLPSKYKHETVKNESLTSDLILTTTRPGDIVLVPFAGSGTECAMSARHGRQFIGYDINQEYVDMSNERVRVELSQPKLFT